jgi:hypothetical protein
MVEAMGLKIVALRSLAMTSSAYKISSKDTHTHTNRQTGDLISLLSSLESGLANNMDIKKFT